MKYIVDTIQMRIGEPVNLEGQKIIKVLKEQEYADLYEHYCELTCLIEIERSNK